jgi:hypothetical protein
MRSVASCAVTILAIAAAPTIASFISDRFSDRGKTAQLQQNSPIASNLVHTPSEAKVAFSDSTGKLTDHTDVTFDPCKTSIKEFSNDGARAEVIAIPSGCNADYPFGSVQTAFYGPNSDANQLIGGTFMEVNLDGTETTYRFDKNHRHYGEQVLPDRTQPKQTVKYSFPYSADPAEVTYDQTLAQIMINSADGYWTQVLVVNPGDLSSPYGYVLVVAGNHAGSSALTSSVFQQDRGQVIELRNDKHEVKGNATLPPPPALPTSGPPAPDIG